MDEHTSFEQAYKNGYEQGQRDAVKHGRWTENHHVSYDDMREEDVHWYTYTCSECAFEAMNNSHCCPNCGARMDLED